jgi:hypothetical protein
MMMKDESWKLEGEPFENRLSIIFQKRKKKLFLESIETVNNRNRYGFKNTIANIAFQGK